MSIILLALGMLLGWFIAPILMLFVKPKYPSVDDQSPNRTVLQDLHTLKTDSGRFLLFGVDVTNKIYNRAEDVIKEIIKHKGGI